MTAEMRNILQRKRIVEREIGHAYSPELRAQLQVQAFRDAKARRRARGEIAELRRAEALFQRHQFHEG